MSVNLANRAASGIADPEVTTWVCRAMAAYVKGSASLEDALGLNRVQRIRSRNDALFRASEILSDGKGDITAWELALLLANAIERYESRFLPAMKICPSTQLSPLNQALSDAFACGVRVPRTQRKIYDLIR